MGKLIKLTIALCVSVMMSTSAWSYVVGDVVQVDEYLGSFSASGSDAEKAGFAGVLDSHSITYNLDEYGKVEWDSDASNPFEDVDGTTWVAALDGDAPDFFSLKFGNVGGDSHLHYVYRNLDSLNYLTVNLANMTGCYTDLCDVVDLTNQTFTVISHYEKIGSTTTVPEPGSLALLGLGLIGLAATRRKIAA